MQTERRRPETDEALTGIDRLRLFENDPYTFDFGQLYASDAVDEIDKLMAEAASLREQIAYWRRGTEVIIKCLEEAHKADPMDAPIPFVGIEAKRWHAFRAEAFRHSLEMMGIPSCFDQMLGSAA